MLNCFFRHHQLPLATYKPPNSWRFRLPSRSQHTYQHLFGLEILGEFQFFLVPKWSQIFQEQPFLWYCFLPKKTSSSEAQEKGLLFKAGYTAVTHDKHYECSLQKFSSPLQPRWEHLSLLFLKSQNLVALAPLTAKVRILPQSSTMLSHLQKEVSFFPIFPSQELLEPIADQHLSPPDNLATIALPCKQLALAIH